MEAPGAAACVSVCVCVGGGGLEVVVLSAPAGRAAFALHFGWWLTNNQVVGEWCDWCLNAGACSALGVTTSWGTGVPCRMPVSDDKGDTSSIHPVSATRTCLAAELRGKQCFLNVRSCLNAGRDRRWPCFNELPTRPAGIS